MSGDRAITTRKALLLRLASAQQVDPTGPATRYDLAASELQVWTNDEWQFAGDVAQGGPKTKKADLEQGEDVKGRW